jgi:2-polyprenyl-6-methoxyphenol hydroxylase-like FAD-dependent oxidoreductase
LQDSYDVAILGAGPSGSVLASLLVEKGLNVILLDKRIGVGPSNHAVALQANSLTALAQIGALEDLLREGQKIYSLAIYDEHHRLLASVDLRELEHPYSYLLLVLPERMTMMFRDRFRKKGGIILEGFELDRLLSNENSTTGVRGVMSGQPMEIRAKLVVGADGPFSKIRTLSGLSYRTRTYEDAYAVAVLPGVVSGPPSRLIIGKGVALGMASLLGQFTYFFCYVSEKDFEHYRKVGLDSLKRRLIELEPELRPPLDSLHEWNQIVFLKPIGVFMKAWTKPGLALVGDAAHAMNPSLAQGMNQSLLDAIALAGVLNECKKRDEFSTEAIRGYERLRHKQATFYVKQSEIGGRLLAPRNSFYSWLAKRTVMKAASNKDKRVLGMKLNAGLLSELGIRDLITLLV